MSVYEYVPSHRFDELRRHARTTAQQMKAEGYERLPFELQCYITEMAAPIRFALTGVRTDTGRRTRFRLRREKWVELEVVEAARVLRRLALEHLRHASDQLRLTTEQLSKLHCTISAPPCSWKSPSVLPIIAAGLRARKEKP